jgi:hypothetical protein
MVAVNVIRKPTANAGPDKTILKGQQVVLDGSASGSNISFTWTPGSFLNNPSLLKPIATPSGDINIP